MSKPERDSPDWGNACWEMASYARDVAGVGKRVARDMGVPEERTKFVRELLQMMDEHDHDALYSVLTEDYGYPAAKAVADLLRARAEVEGGLRDDPTDPVWMVIPPEAKP